MSGLLHCKIASARPLVYIQTSSLGPPQRTSSTFRWSVWPVGYFLTAKSRDLTVAPDAVKKPVEALSE